MATINDLAQEIINQIISNVRDLNTPFRPGKKRNDLVSTSLVAWAWKKASQEAMWRSIAIEDDYEALDRLAASPILGEFRIRDLILHVSRRLRVGWQKVRLVEKILKAVTITHSLDLEAMFLHDYTERLLDPAVFSSPGLSGLHTLTLQADCLYPRRRPNFPVPSFALTDLTLHCCDSRLGGVVGALLNTSRHSLKFLSLHGTIEPLRLVLRELEYFLPRILPSLHCLEVRHLHPQLCPSLIHATSLTRLVWSTIDDILHIVTFGQGHPSKCGIKYLQSLDDYPMEAQDAMRFLHLVVDGPPPVLRYLERLEFPRMDEDPFKNASKYYPEEAVPLLAALDARGIEVTHGV